jgi:hypothetical protein
MPSIPWGTILKNAPAILGAADALLAQARRRTAATEVSGDLNVLRRRIVELDEQQRASAELVKQLADQVNAMTLAAEQSAARLRLAYGLAIAGTLLGITGCLMALILN